jgi:hypothetical protein
MYLIQVRRFVYSWCDVKRSNAGCVASSKPTGRTKCCDDGILTDSLDESVRSVFNYDCDLVLSEQKNLDDKSNT